MGLTSWFPRYRKLPLPPNYERWLIPLLLLVIIFQVGEMESGEIKFSFYRTSLLIIYYSVWWAFTPLVYGLMEHYDQQIKSIGFLTTSVVQVLIILVVHLLISNLLLSLTEAFIFRQSGNHFAQLGGIWPALLFNRLVTLIIIILLLKVIDNFQQLQQTRLTLVNTENQLQQTQLERLQSQLNPHFLFNSLHTITSLIGYDDPKAREMTVHLSDMLRLNLEKEQHPFQTLEEEVQYIKAYITIQQERFQDWVTATVQIDTTVLDKQVPSLILQPLVENAFIHGIDGLTEKGYLSIRISQEKDLVVIRIDNSVNPSFQSAISTGLGLKNVEKRLSLLYEEKALMTINRKADSFSVTLKLPVA